MRRIGTGGKSTLFGIEALSIQVDNPQIRTPRPFPQLPGPSSGPRIPGAAGISQSHHRSVSLPFSSLGKRRLPSEHRSESGDAEVKRVRHNGRGEPSTSASVTGRVSAEASSQPHAPSPRKASSFFPQTSLPLLQLLVHLLHLHRDMSASYLGRHPLPVRELFPITPKHRDFLQNGVHQNSVRVQVHRLEHHSLLNERPSSLPRQSRL